MIFFRMLTEMLTHFKKVLQRNGFKIFSQGFESPHSDHTKTAQIL